MAAGASSDVQTTLAVDARRALAELQAVEQAALRARAASTGVTALPGVTTLPVPVPSQVANRTALPVTEAAISAAGLRTLNSRLFPTLGGKVQTAPAIETPPKPNTAPPSPGQIPSRPPPIPSVSSTVPTASSSFDPKLAGRGIDVGAFQLGQGGLAFQAGRVFGPAFGLLVAAKGAEAIGNAVADAGRKAALAALAEGRNFAEATVAAVGDVISQKAQAAAGGVVDTFAGIGAGLLSGAVATLGTGLSAIDAVLGTGQNERIARETEENIRRVRTGRDVITGAMDRAEKKWQELAREVAERNKQRQVQLNEIVAQTRAAALAEAESSALELLGHGYPGTMGELRHQVLGVIEDARVKDAEERFKAIRPEVHMTTSLDDLRNGEN